jgi:phytoene dehydrogenase-like protein
MTEFDVIVVGAGIGSGLTAATYLQKAGLNVCLIERRHEVGTFIPTMEHWPNVLNSPHAAINFSGGSPIIEDLELERYGYRVVCTPVIFIDVHKDGKACGLFYDVKETKESFAKFSEKDAKMIEKIQTKLMQNLVEYTQLVAFTPHPHRPEVIDRIWQMSADFFDLDVENFKTMNAFELLEETFESDYTRRTLITLPSLNLMGDTLARGQGACTVPFDTVYFSGQAVGGNHTLAHAMLRCFLDHGGTILTNCPVEKIIVQNGEARGVILSKDAVFPGKAIYAREAVISAVGVTQSLKLIGEDVVQAIDYRLWYKMKYWKTDFRASTCSHWILKGHPKWKAIDFDPRVKKAHLLYRAWDSWEHCKKWTAAMKSQEFWESYDGLCEILDFSVADPTQASPEGFTSLRAEIAVPIHGPGKWRIEELHRWDEVKEELASKRDELFEELAPGFKEIELEHMYYTPIDIWRFNPSAPYGQVIGGDFSEDQWIMDRVPYRTPIKKLYLSLGCWPLTLSWGANGYNAACIVIEDLGLKRPSWWVHKPWEYFINNIDRILVDPTWV